METKEYYEAFLAVIDYFDTNNQWDISPEKGFEIAGDYWPRIFEEIKGRQIGTDIIGAGIHLSSPHKLRPLRADFRNAVKEIEKQEEDRLLDNASKYSGIKYARRSFIISLIALIAAIGSLAWQIIIVIS